MEPSKTSFRDVFSEAAEIIEPAARAVFLDSACRGDDVLRARVERLLEADARAGDFLRDRATARFTEKIGDRIGRYRLRERIGRGGCGVVYLAEQEEPVRREVALKVIKLGMDTRSVVARFDAERQALALMDHPNIARVLDAGATETGRPFFVMELVRGVPITDYCEQHGLSFRPLLELFIQICQAVQHAHQKGIIHRDLKPSNILVATTDGVPVPKVIDFGIAKATEQGRQEHAGLTSLNQFIGTPAYMSPEQVGLGGRDMDTRSDIYSLGVILYELVAGQPPFMPQELTQGGLDEMRRIICEIEPLTPSKQVQRKLNLRIESPGPRHDYPRPPPDSQLKPLATDLDWIVMKCLEKERARRYETASSLAADIRRHLDHETISARPPTAFYRFQKVVRRHRVGFAAVTVVALILLMAVVVSSQLAVRARRAETLANRRLTESIASEARAVKAEKEANDRAAAELTARKNSEANAIFLVNVFAAGDHPGRDPRTITVAERLGEAVQQLRSLRNQPGEQKELMFTLGRSYLSLNLPREAAPLLEEYRDYCLTAFGPEDRRTFKTISLLATTYGLSGRAKDSLDLREELLRQERRVLGTNDHSTQLTMEDLAHTYTENRRWNEAIELQEELLYVLRNVKRPKDGVTLDQREYVQVDLAKGYLAVGRYDEAVALRKELLERSLELRGPEHPETIEAMDHLASTCLMAGRQDEALQHWTTASAHNQSDRIYDIKIAGLLVWFGKSAEHESMSARLLKATAGTSNAHVANCVAKLASLRLSPDPQRRELALVLAQRTVEFGQKDSLLPWFQMSLGMAEYRQGDYTEANEALMAADHGAEKSAPKHKPFIQGTARFYRAMSLFRQGNKLEARQIFSQAAAAMKPLPPDEKNPLAAGANHDDLVLWLAYKETKALLTEPASSQ